MRALKLKSRKFLLEILNVSKIPPINLPNTQPVHANVRYFILNINIHSKLSSILHLLPPHSHILVPSNVIPPKGYFSLFGKWKKNKAIFIVVPFFSYPVLLTITKTKKYTNKVEIPKKAVTISIVMMNHKGRFLRGDTIQGGMNETGQCVQ